MFQSVCLTRALLWPYVIDWKASTNELGFWIGAVSLVGVRGPACCLAKPLHRALATTHPPPKPYVNHNWCRVWFNASAVYTTSPQISMGACSTQLPPCWGSVILLELLGMTRREQTTKGYFRKHWWKILRNHSSPLVCVKSREISLLCNIFPST